MEKNKSEEMMRLERRRSQQLMTGLLRMLQSELRENFPFPSRVRSAHHLPHPSKRSLAARRSSQERAKLVRDIGRLKRDLARPR